jgi:hypothetical protein
MPEWLNNETRSYNDLIGFDDVLQWLLQKLRQY